MENIIRRFFEGLAGPRPGIPRTISGTLRFDLQDDKGREQWLVTFDKGVVSATESDAPAECVVRTDKETFAAILEGRANAMAALLRGVMDVEGRTLLMVIFRSLIAAPVTTPSDLEAAGYARRQT
jgi:putative sterol carrier protein